MSEKSVSKAFRAAVDKLASCKTLLAVTHARPDGDGLGAMVALCRAAQAAGKTAYALLHEDVPSQYEFLFPDEKPAGLSRMAKLADQADLIVVLDTASQSQMEDIAPHLAARPEKVLVIDHHATVGVLSPTQWVDPTAAAAGVMVGELLVALGWPVDARSAEALMAAVVSDTGWLQYANTDGRSLRLAAGWLDAGVRTDKLYRRMYQNARINRLKLLAHVLDDLELHSDGRLAVMTIRREDFANTEARADETENLINSALQIGTVETAIMLVENAENIRVSLRSRDAVDVAAIAQQFGGGGHKRAAGMRIVDDIDVIKDKIIHICARALDEGG